MSTTLRLLKQEKKKLIILVKKQDIAMAKKDKARREFMQLKAEVRALKQKTNRRVVPKLINLTSRAKQRLSDPETRRKVAVEGRKLKKAFRAFQRFANRHG